MVHIDCTVGSLLAVALSILPNIAAAAGPLSCSAVTVTVTQIISATCSNTPSSFPSPSSAVSSIIRASSVPSSQPSASATCAFWLGDIQHQGISAFNPNVYRVFRNVKDFGAKGK